ncbi:MAG: GspE/PulE family protein [Methylacidiphilales bacterium]|nr:GspE/PulE family protein [Candidatus Methylacidiphilales bacterium]
MFLQQQLADLARQSGCEDGAALSDHLQKAVAMQKSLVTAVLDSDLVEEERFISGMAGLFGIPCKDEVLPAIPAALRDKFPARIALRYHLLPMGEDADGFWLSTYDPFDLVARKAAAQTVPDRPIQWVLASRRKILQSLRQGYGVGAETFDQILEGREIDDALQEIKQEINVLDPDESEASVVKFVNQIMREALEEHATDIHIEPLENDLRIRYRIDGVLHEVPVPSQIKLLQASVISRVKIMAHLDIAEKRLPQDGRINLELEGQPIDVRVACIPSVTGESISLRLLGQQQFDFALLGLDSAAEQKVRSLLSQPNGIVLLTGPTGCGKSTSLYTFLSSLNTKERRIVTIEDPVEHKLDGVIQIAVKPEIELTFAAGLRSILRGDPNVIMVGEMRDFETAEIAVRAALTGHLVFSTLHTNDAIGGITRLIDMGVEPFLVGSSVRAFIAQRLVRVLCPHCRRPASHPDSYLKEIGFPLEKKSAIYQPQGCERCRNTGYMGRTAIFEICLVSKRIEDLITQKKSAGALRAVALEEGMLPLRQYGFSKVIAGITTVEEVVRVTSADIAVLDE